MFFHAHHVHVTFFTCESGNNFNIQNIQNFYIQNIQNNLDISLLSQMNKVTLKAWKNISSTANICKGKKSNLLWMHNHSKLLYSLISTPVNSLHLVDGSLLWWNYFAFDFIITYILIRTSLTFFYAISLLGICGHSWSHASTFSPYRPSCSLQSANVIWPTLFHGMFWLNVFIDLAYVV